MSLPYADRYNGRSVFVTGHTGFKGSWMCLWLKQLGARVTGYALEPPTAPDNFTIARVRETLATHHVADVRDMARLRAAMDGARPDVVFHLAAQSVVREAHRDPRGTFDVNMMGTVNVLEVVRRLGRPCAVVVVTSDKCYENREQVWGYRETDALGDREPYGASKAAAEIVSRSYRESFFNPERLPEHGVKLASARVGNVIGGGDWTYDSLFGDLVRAITRNERVELRSPGACRPWQHVLQALSGYLALGAKLLESEDPRFCSEWNFGPLPGSELEVREVVRRFLEHWGSGSWREVSDPAQPHEATVLRLCIDKALWTLGWRPRWDVYQALLRTGEWYRKFQDTSSDMHRFSLEQIADYEAAPPIGAPRDAAPSLA